MMLESASPTLPGQAAVRAGRLLALLLLLALLAPSALAASSRTASLDKQYRQAKAYYQNLAASPAKAKKRENWLRGIAAFREIFDATPASDLAPRSLFMMARLYREAYSWSGNPLDLAEAIASYDDVARRFPAHRLADDSLYAMGLLYLTEKGDPGGAAKTFAKLVALYPDGDMVAAAREKLLPMAPAESEAAAPPPAAPVSGEKTLEADVKKKAAKADKFSLLQTVRHWSTSDYTRVVVEAAEPVEFEEHLLKKSGDLPRRLYVDFRGCRLDPALREPIPIENGLLKRVRAGQFAPDTVRVVLDIQSIAKFKVFSLQEPFRVVIDVMGSTHGQAVQGPGAEATPTLAQQLGLGIGKIVLDPGHGGKDPGALGQLGLKEKDVVLAVARKTAQKLQELLPCEVVLTRDRDVFIPLEERTAIANTERGDLFISIHANSAPSPEVHGIETYFLDLATNADAMRVAARENATSARSMSDLQMILTDLMQNNKLNESAKLAEFVQANMVEGLGSRFGKVNNLGVKQAPFYVLIGAQMPAILTEISFLTNPVEARRLTRDDYLDAISDQLVAGVKTYVTENSVAFLGKF